MRRTIAVIVVGTLAVALSMGCAMSARDKGVMIGGTSGAVLGGVIGHQSDNTAVGAILGAVVGGAAGGIIGNYMDDQAAEMQQDIEGARIERIGEGIKITFDSGILFDVDKYELREQAKRNIESLAIILNKYEDTNILLAGHTDSDGSDEHNMTLSERRARAVAGYLAANSVTSGRISVTGFGESQPIANNNTVEGKQANRRVEVAVMANDDLKRAAEEQAAQN
ncbi:MAG: OmpA family protein [Armatimonadetes bacterium]|nr:OmpA family protein [Armatimonadota bacterium]